jgi:hypothetical protein
MKSNVVRCLSVAFVLACVVSAVSANASTIPTSSSPGGTTVPGSGSGDPLFYITFGAGPVGNITGWADITVINNVVTAATGSITDTSADFIAAIGSSGPFTINGVTEYAEISDDNGDNNLFNYPGGTWPYVDFQGLSFSTTSGANFNIYGDSIYGPPNGILVSEFDETGYPLGYGGTTAPGAYDLDYLRVPDGGTTLVLLGLAVAGLAGLRRKLRA